MEQLNIRVGAFYRMRCGGAVRIEKVYGHEVQSDDTSWYQNADGDWWIGEDQPSFNLVAEISEQEYNRIISGGTESWITQTEKERKEIESLKAENARLTEAYDGSIQSAKDWQESYFKLMKDTENERRFEAAKAAMQGLLAANAKYGGRTNNYVMLAQDSINSADALLKALEESK